MMDLSIVLLEVAQLRQQDLLRQAEAGRRLQELEELRPSLPQQAFNRVRLAMRQSKIQFRSNFAPSNPGQP